MTGITADLTLLPAVAERLTRVAGRLRSTPESTTDDPPPLSTLPQARQFVAALSSARSHQQSAVSGFSRFYGAAGVSLAALGQSLTDIEDAAARNFGGLDGRD